MGKSLIITTGGGTDTSDGNPNIIPSAMLKFETAYDKDGEIIEGSIPHGHYVKTGLNSGESTAIPEGYYDGTSDHGRVNARSIRLITNGVTASASNILSGYTGWRDGDQITGTMANKGAANSTLSANGTYTVPVGWHNGSGKVTQSLSTQGAKTVTPSTSNQTVVATSKWVTADQIVAGNTNLTSENIKKDVTIFGVTGSFLTSQTGFVTDRWLIRNGVKQSTCLADNPVYRGISSTINNAYVPNNRTENGAYILSGVNGCWWSISSSDISSILKTGRVWWRYKGTGIWDYITYKYPDAWNFKEYKSDITVKTWITFSDAILFKWDFDDSRFDGTPWDTINEDSNGYRNLSNFIVRYATWELSDDNGYNSHNLTLPYPYPHGQKITKEISYRYLKTEKVWESSWGSFGHKGELLGFILDPDDRYSGSVQMLNIPIRDEDGSLLKNGSYPVELHVTDIHTVIWFDKL